MFMQRQAQTVYYISVSFFCVTEYLWMSEIFKLWFCSIFGWLMEWEWSDHPLTNDQFEHKFELVKMMLCSVSNEQRFTSKYNIKNMMLSNELWVTTCFLNTSEFIINANEHLHFYFLLLQVTLNFKLNQKNRKAHPTLKSSHSDCTASKSWLTISIWW